MTRFALDLPDVRRNPTLEWWLAESGKHITHRGRRLDFGRNPFQVAILQDTAREIVIRKSTQCGISEIMLCWMLACADQGLSVFVAFPDQVLRNNYVRERFDPTVQASDYYRQLVEKGKLRSKGGRDAADSVGMKQIGRAAIGLFGSNSAAAFRSFVADAVLVEEVDQCDQRNLAHIKDRLGASPHRLDRRVGNPSISGFGIDALYADSDRKQWRIRCTSCNSWQTPDWFANVVREVDEGRYEPRHEGLAVVCRGCGSALDRHASGEWVAEYPDRPISGYAISQLFSGTVTIQEMWESFNKGLRNETELMRFHNSVLGMAYESEGAKLSPPILDRCIDDYPRQSASVGVFGGVDVGSLLHVTLIDGDRLVVIEALPGTGAFETLDHIMAAHKPDLLVIDAMPETRAARMFAERHAGQVLLCYFVDSKKVADFDVDYAAMTVKCDRTQTLDESHAALLRGELRLPRDVASVSDFYAQMCAPTRVFAKRNASDPGRFVWREGAQADHYRHALNYAWLARSIQTRHGAGVVVL